MPRVMRGPASLDTVSKDAKAAQRMWNEMRTHGFAVLDLTDEEAKSAVNLTTFLQESRSYLAWKRMDGKDSLTFRQDNDPGSAFKEQACMDLERMARRVLHVVGSASGMSIPRLDDVLDPVPLPQGHKSSSCLQARMYSAGTDAGSAADCGCVDSSIITLVMSDQPGLQVLGSMTGQWQDVPLGPGKVAVLVGYGLGFITGGVLRPADHRVLPPPPAAAAAAVAPQQQDRLSLSFQLCFSPTAWIVPSYIMQHVTLHDLIEQKAPRKLVTDQAIIGTQLLAQYRKKYPHSIGSPGAAPAVGLVAAVKAAVFGGSMPRQARDAQSQMGDNNPPPAKRSRRAVHHDAAGAAVKSEPNQDAAGAADVNHQGDHRSPPPPHKPAPGLIIRIVDQSKGELHFRAAATAKLTTVMRMYCKQKGLAKSSVDFFYKGENVSRPGDGQTLQDLGVEDNDPILALVKGDAVD